MTQILPTGYPCQTLSAVTRPSLLENQLDEMNENDNDFEVLEVRFTDEETEEFEETDEW